MFIVNWCVNQVYLKCSIKSFGIVNILVNINSILRPGKASNGASGACGHIVGYPVIVTSQLQLQFNLSWCDLNLTLHNNAPPF